MKKKKRNKKKSKPSNLPEPEIVQPSCTCGVPAAGPRPSKTRKNKDRQFYYCGESKQVKTAPNQSNQRNKRTNKKKEEHKCDFILWVDEM